MIVVIYAGSLIVSCNIVCVAGVFGVPLDICVRSFLDALLIFNNQRRSNSLREVHFINRDTDAVVTAIVLLQTALEGDMGTLLSQALEKFNRFQAKELGIPKGRSERTTDYGAGATSGSSFAKSLYRGISVGATSDTELKTPPRRSSSLSRISKTVAADTSKGTKDDSSKAYSLKSSSDLGTGRTSPMQRPSGVTDTKTNTTETNTADLLTRLSKFSSPTSSPKSDRELMMRTTPNFKQTLLSTTGTKDYKVKGIKKSSDVSSPSGKVRVNRDVDSHAGDQTVQGASGVSRSSPTPSAASNRDDFGLHSLPADLGRVGAVLKSPKTGEVEKCLICLDTCKRPKTLELCKHVFCTKCIEEYFKKSKPSCPICGTIYGKLKGTQPRDGTMTHGVKHSVFLPGYERAEGTIVIKYMFPSGTQKVGAKKNTIKP